MVDPRLQGRWGTAQVSGRRAVGIQRYERADAPPLDTLYRDTPHHLPGISQASVLSEALIPYIVSVTVATGGTTVTLTFSETLKTGEPAATGWQMGKNGGALENVAGGAITESILLTLTVPAAQSPLAAGDTCRIVYTDAASPLSGDRTGQQVPDQDFTFVVAFDVPITGPGFGSGFDGGFE